MAEVIVHLDREWKDGIIRMDYKWEREGKEFLIQDVPCTRFPFGTDDYLSDTVSLALELIMYLQQTGEVSQDVCFMDVENLVDEWEKDSDVKELIDERKKNQ